MSLYDIYLGDPESQNEVASEMASFIGNTTFV